MKRWIAATVLVLVMTAFGQGPPHPPFFGSERLERAPEFAVRIVREQFADVFAVLAQDGLTFDWEGAWADLRFYRLTTNVSYQVWVPVAGRSDLVLSAIAWDDRAYNPILYVEARPGYWAGWSLQYSPGSDPFSAFMAYGYFEASPRPLVSSSEFRVLIAKWLPHAYQTLYASKVAAAR
ncbi:hypothetical protein ACMC9I_09130 [Deinococcota bacterium DY0809b]